MSTVFVVAVSGGVDSVVLLDMLVNSEKRLAGGEWQQFDANAEFIVANFDHGIREESQQNTKFAKELAKKHGLKFELGEAKLGKNASEEESRKVRYDFLRRCCKKHNAQLITAHHQDDVIETAIINLLRGTGWRGLASLSSNQQVTRPLLGVTKSDLLRYAKEHELTWYEDTTNQNTDYLRNYIRLKLLPCARKSDQDFNKNLLKHIKEVQKIRQEIEAELNNIVEPYRQTPETYNVPRYQLIMWPTSVAREVIYTVLTQLHPEWHPEASAIERALHFVKTAKIGKKFDLSKRLKITATQDVATFKSNR